MTAHPRSRGENLVGLNSGPELGGSSPLTRGKLARPHPRQPGPRLIPAHAGKTTSPRGMRPSGQAHPRSRGENPPRKPLWTSTWGSSPLTRGKRAVAPGIERDLRLIPAHAGKTILNARRVPSGAAHPRSRGENRRTRHVGGRCLGSSPLTRGKRPPDPRSSGSRRLIPAHAGKTTSRPSPIRPTPAHPRSRGENSARALTVSCQTGSSPLTRGKRR